MAVGIGTLSNFNGNEPSTIIAIGTHLTPSVPEFYSGLASQRCGSRTGSTVLWRIQALSRQQ
ncbi:high-affinity Zn(2+) transporter zrt1 [Vermiconidia calcicola]|uniref:High-affinity Zn(2+) transporter zrt1 n=1 Tax=Vermiconidia calcicola TaxID=1690605 RepID=A0ACC3MEU8_9PEZI|nr:high-affinity Zn(2+) transporter zrt1 [Vermiconidia calcicola]